MLERKQLIREMESLPQEYLQEIADFIGYLKLKNSKTIPETMLFSEKSLAKDWGTPEEDEAWANL
jgi:hypothetical protein